jgi:indole-3-glycerol phosphate synthase
VGVVLYDNDGAALGHHESVARKVLGNRDLGVSVVTMSTYLDRILAAHEATAALDSRSVTVLSEAASAGPPVRGFRARLASTSGLAVIAEIKRRSPSKGVLAASVDAAAVARAYSAGGAAALSVLTDEEFFGGSASDLVTARSATTLPVLRKDFTVCAADVYDARAMGADAVLLIAAAIAPARLQELHALVLSLGMDALVEVHDEDELRLALSVGSTLIGVNQRDLVSFAVDTSRALRMAALIPDDVIGVAESGIDGPESARRLASAGYRAVLVGETLMRAADPAAAVSELCA